jgi:hypothetical protein
MAEIFLSYANEDRETALRISELLESAGWTVWWDRRIPAGRTWRSVIEEALVQMRCMVVLWSRHSIESDWVKEEAEEARELGKLVPVLIEPVKPPVGFRAIQAADLTEWDGSTDAPGAQQLIADLSALIGALPQKSHTSAAAPSGEPTRSPVEAAESSAPPGPRQLAKTHRGDLGGLSRFSQKQIIAASGGLALLLIVGGFLFWMNTGQNDADQNSISTVNEQYPPSKEAPAPQLVNLKIEGGRAKLKPKETVTLGVRGEYSDGQEKQIDSTLEWSSSNPRIAAVDGNGTVTALEAGTAEITGRYNGLTTSPFSLTVAAEATAKPEPTLVGLRIQRPRKELNTNEKVSLRVRGNYSDGTEKALLQNVDWQTSDPKVARVNSKGELETLQAGEFDVVANVAGVRSSPSHFVVKGIPQRAQTEAAAQKTSGTAVVNPPVRPVVNVMPYLNRAKDYRVQGNYTAALTELEKARSLDDTNSEVQREIEQTRRACNAEKRLGRYDLQC